MKIKEISVKFELSTTPKPYSSIKAGLTLTASLEKNDDPDEVYSQIYQYAQDKVITSLGESIQMFREKLD